MKPYDNKYVSNENNKNSILTGSQLLYSHIDYVLFLLKESIQNEYYSSVWSKNVFGDSDSNNKVKEILRTKEHIQIIHSCDDNCETCENGHWICLYYNTKAFYVYDSLNCKTLNGMQIKFIKKLFPYTSEYNIFFPTVQQQREGSFDCGVFAITFAISLAFKINPADFIYDYDALRPHIYNIFTKYKTLVQCPILERKAISKSIFSRIPSIDEIKGITNVQGVSCYASAIFQSIYHNSYIRDTILSSKSTNSLKACFLQYLHKTSDVDIMKLRMSTGSAEFSKRAQQDVAEFFNYLCQFSEELRSIIEFRYYYEYFCKKCLYSKNNQVESSMIKSLVVPRNSSCSLQNLIESNSITQTEICCNDNCRTFLQEKFHPSYLNKVVVLQLNIFVSTYTAVNKINDFHLENPLNDVIKFNEKNYKVSSVIFHIGIDGEEGHYICMIRGQRDDNTNIWIEANDNVVTEKRWSTQEQNAYMIFMEEISSDSISNHSFLLVNDSNSNSDLRNKTLTEKENINSQSSSNSDSQKSVDYYKIYMEKNLAQNRERRENKRNTAAKNQQVTKSQNQRKCSNYYNKNKGKILEKLREKRAIAKKLNPKSKKLENDKVKKDQILTNQIFRRATKRKNDSQNEYESITFGHDCVKNMRTIDDDCSENFNNYNNHDTGNDNGLIVTPNSIKNSLEVSNSIKKKYTLFKRNLKSTKFLIEDKEYYIKNLIDKIDSASFSDRKMEADHLVTHCIYLRDDKLFKFKNSLKLCRERAGMFLARLGGIVIEENLECAITALCGIAGHSSSSEPWYNTGAYCVLESNKEDYEKKQVGDFNLIVDNKGTVMNMLPNLQETKFNRKIWTCNRLCKSIDKDIIKELKHLYEDLSELSFDTAHRYFQTVDFCAAESRNVDKKGHPEICYMNPITCGSKFLYLHVLSFHYPQLRTLKRIIYRIKQIYAQIVKIESSLIEGDYESLKIILSESEKILSRVDPSKVNEISLDENELKNIFQVGIKEYTKIILDTPIIPCVSCERLFRSKSVEKAETLSKREDPSEELLELEFERLIGVPLKKNVTKIDLLERHCGPNGFDGKYVCTTCRPKVKNNEMPSMCVLNNMAVAEIPIEISNLNEFEKTLIQRAKAFQSILKLDTVMKKNIPHHVKIDKVKGRTFHLPLPIEETLEKICSETDPLNTDNNLFILVRSWPSKAKIIWEDLIDIKKIWKALDWLKRNNPHYKKIILPLQAQELLKQLNKENLQYEISNNNTNIESEENEPENLADPGINNSQKKGALLTQKVETDSYYEEYTIYPLYGNKINEKDNKLYQMLKVFARPIDYRSNNLDLLCFPDLYPTGINGQYEFRNVKLRDFDYIRARLTSIHSRFRTNKQFLFFSLYNNTMRQLNGGIFHKLNITNPKYKCTAGELLANINNTEYSSNIMSIFARLRGTQAYWSRVRNDINCMMFEYGPVTWFITFSPGEWMWSGLREFIRTVNGWKHDKRSISELITIDPVSASIYIYHTFKAMLAYILSPANPIGKVLHYYYTCEYQGRGMPHYHCLFWIKDAPIYGTSTNQEVSEFILKYVTCHVPNRKTSPELYRRVMDYQQHKHNNYCMRSKKKLLQESKRIADLGFLGPLVKH
ncbi:hypothetical protein TKK_0015569 [Trichogramma kaykai]